MKRHQVAVGLLIVFLSVLLYSGVAIAEPQTTPTTPQITTQPPLTSIWEKLERLRDDRQLQELVEEDLEKSIVIRAQIQEEVDRAFGHTTALLNVLLGVLTALPILAAASIWFIRRSVLNQIITETKKQLQEEVEKQLEAEVAAELRQQAEAFQQKLEQLEAEFQTQLSQLKNLFSDTQREKDQIIQELAQITPSPLRETAPPETHQKIQALTKQLEVLKSNNAQLQFTANDYIEQGKALYFESRYEDAIACYDRALELESENARAYFSRGAALVKLQRHEAALEAYDRAIQLKPDFFEAWFGRGTALTKLQQYDTAITAYEKAILIKPDLLVAWFGKARCFALQDQADAAIDSLTHAIQLHPEKAKEAARTDPSFDRLRQNEIFKKLVEDSQTIA
jgi:tetratricopeptide (TPR) repeat protein